MFRIRRIVEGYACRLEPVDVARAAGASAKAERERFENGDERLKVKVRRLDLPDGTSLDVLFNDARLGWTILAKGAARFLLESSEGHTVPNVQAGDSIVIASNGVPILRGVFRPD